MRSSCGPPGRSSRNGTQGARAWMRTCGRSLLRSEATVRGVRQHGRRNREVAHAQYTPPSRRNSPAHAGAHRHRRWSILRQGALLGRPLHAGRAARQAPVGRQRRIRPVEPIGPAQLHLLPPWRGHKALILAGGGAESSPACHASEGLASKGYTVVGSFSPAVIAAVTTVAAGAILAMIADTTIPEAFDDAHLAIGLITVSGFLVSFALSNT